MIESLFGYANMDKNKIERKKESASLEPSIQYIQIIDTKKAQNLSILLRALNVTTEEVLDALQEGLSLSSLSLSLSLSLLQAPEVRKHMHKRNFFFNCQLSDCSI
jgi:hypothetical protein